MIACFFFKVQIQKATSAIVDFFHDSSDKSKFTSLRVLNSVVQSLTLQYCTVLDMTPRLAAEQHSKLRDVKTKMARQC
jgi:hypothetical protein